MSTKADDVVVRASKSSETHNVVKFCCSGTSKSVLAVEKVEAGVDRHTGDPMAAEVGAKTGKNR